MKVCAAVLTLFGLALTAFGQAPVLDWEHSFGTPYGNEEAFAVVQMTDGGFAVGGYTDGPLSHGMKDFYVVKVDENGQTLWERTYTYVGGQRDEICYSMAATQDNDLILAGYTQAEARTNDILLIRTDHWGDVVWTRVLQAEPALDDPHPHQVALDIKILEVSGQDNGIIIAGFWEAQDHSSKRPLIIETDMQGFVRSQNIYDFFYLEESAPFACATGVDILPNNVGLAITGTAMETMDDPNPWAFYATTYYPWGELDEVCWPEGDLAVSPVVNADGTITMLVQAALGNLSISEVLRGTQQCEIFGLGSFPQRVFDRVRVIDGGPMILAGLMRDDAGIENGLVRRLMSNGDTQWSVPYLNNLPVIGSLFRDVHHRQNEQELLILVGAQIIDTERGPDDLHRDLLVVKYATPLSSETPASVATDYTMSAYPNPFNPNTTISFSLPQAAAVQLSVFDILGNEVARLAGGTFEPGEHRLTFDAADLASGLYFARLETPQRTLTQKLMLMR